MQSAPTPDNKTSLSSISSTTDASIPLRLKTPSAPELDSPLQKKKKKAENLVSDDNETESKEPIDPWKAEAIEAKEASENEAKELAKQKIDFISTPYRTAAEIKFHEACHWILKADSDGNFIDWAQTEVLKLRAEAKSSKEAQATQWIYSPNATDDKALELAINRKPRDTSGSHTVQLYTETLFSLGLMHVRGTKIIQPGTLWTTEHFKGRQEIRFVSSNGVPETYSLATIGHKYVNMFQLNNPFIHDKNITIVTIQPGYIGIAMVKNTPVILLPGRHAYNTPDFSMDAKNRLNVRDNMSTILEQFPTLTITRVLPGEIAIADDNGNPKVLLPGTYIRNSTTFQFITKLDALTLKPIQSDKITEEKREAKEEMKIAGQTTGSFYKYKSLTLINVGLNEYGCAITNEGYKLLTPGIHLFNDSNFRFVKFADRSSADIHHGPIRIVRVEPGSLGLATNITLNKAIILHSGTYTFTGFDRQFKEFKKLSDEKINHLNYTRAVVNSGFVGKAKRGPLFELLQPGIYEEYDPLFTFQEQKELAKEEVIQHGNQADVIVKSGTARAVYLNGKLEMLTESRQFRNEKTLLICDYVMPMSKQIYDLKPEIVSTQDGVPYEVIPQVMFAITNPKQLILELKEEVARDPQQHIEKRLTAIIRDEFKRYESTILNPTNRAEALGEKKGGTGEEKRDRRLGIATIAEEGKQKSRTSLDHDVFNAIKKDLEPCGIEICEFEFLKLDFADPSMRTNTAQNTAKLREQEMKLQFATAEAAVAYAQMQATVARQQLEKTKTAETSLQEAKLITEKQMLETKQQAMAATEKKTIETRNQNEINLALAKATADAIRIKADADSYAETKKAETTAAATLITAEAEAKGNALKFAAEAEGARKKNEADLIKYHCEGFVRYKIAEAQIEMAAQLARAPAPMISVQGGADNRMTDFAKSMLSGRSASGLVNTLLKQKSMFRSLPRSASDPDLSLALNREFAESKQKSAEPIKAPENRGSIELKK